MFALIWQATNRSATLLVSYFPFHGLARSKPGFQALNPVKCKSCSDTSGYLPNKTFRTVIGLLLKLFFVLPLDEASL